ncbi:MAG: PepSY domain-containing protein [Rhizobacter sp.]
MSFKSAAALALLLTIGGAATAGTDKCNAGPKDQWQPLEALEKRLRSEGWTIMKSKIDSGCYKILGKRDKGQHLKAYFNPKTLEILKDG